MNEENKSLLSNDNTSTTVSLQGKKTCYLVFPYQRIKEVQKKESTLQCTLLVFHFLRLQT